jgi:hypothetical protein
MTSVCPPLVNKTALARALALKVTAEFVDEVTASMDKAVDPPSFWRHAVHYTLDRAASDQRMKALLGADGIDAFLPLFTTDGHPMIAETGGRIAPEVCRRWPNLDPARVAEATDATARLIISYIMLPGEPAEAVADRIAGLAIAYLAIAYFKAPEHLIRPSGRLVSVRQGRSAATGFADGSQVTRTCSTPRWETFGL